MSTTTADVKDLPVLHWADNPFGLVYEGAITENLPGQVQIHRVRYPLHGVSIAADIYTPAGYTPASSYPAVVVAHPNGGIKEQVAGRYAQRLAEAGYIAITADAAYQGASGGEPRQIDTPTNRVEDIHGMADHILTHPGVDPTRVGLLGICGGGGYSLKAAQSDKRFTAVGTVSMFNSGRVRRDGLQDSQKDTVQQRLRQASDARAAEERGDVRYSGDANLTDQQIADQPFDLYREGYEYYWKTHAHPGSSFKYTTSSLLELMAFDATDQIGLIDVPLPMIAGSAADTRYLTEEAFAKADGTTDKQLHLIEGATHIQTYWVDEYVDEALAQLTAFYNRTLTTSTEPTDA